MQGPLARLTRRLVDQPIFVMGFGRSGTTVLANALRRHPNILGARIELVISRHLASVIGEVYDSDHAAWTLDNLMFPEAYLRGELKRLAFEAAVGRPHGLTTFARDLVKGDNRNVFGRRFWSSKAFVDEEGHDHLTELFPDARFIYIVRSGEDVVQSRRKSHMFSGREFETHCRDWAAWIEDHQYRIDKPSTANICQEDLANTPEAVFSKVFAELGVPEHDRPAEYCATTLVHPHAQATEKAVSVTQMLTDRPPAHESWSAEERRIFLDICGDAMELAGYPLSFRD